MTNRDPNYEARVRASFLAQRFMATIGASLERIAPGEVVIAVPFREDLTQQHGFLHAGVIGAIADSACGYAALSLMEPGAAVLSVEYKLNLLAPAAGTRFMATGRVVRSGKTLTICTAEVRAMGEGPEVLVALMQATMIALHDRAGLRD
jgi:uncharacterized protein (TIGR00369 family)